MNAQYTIIDGKKYYSATSVENEISAARYVIGNFVDYYTQTGIDSMDEEEKFNLEIAKAWLSIHV